MAPWVINRLERAETISNQLGGIAIVTLSAGTPYKPPVIVNGYPVFESVAGARYLVDKLGVDPSLILTETSSYDTMILSTVSV